MFAKYLLHLIVLHFEICALEYVTLILLELLQMVSIELFGEEALKYMVYPVLLIASSKGCGYFILLRGEYIYNIYTENKLSGWQDGAQLAGSVNVVLLLVFFVVLFSPLHYFPAAEAPTRCSSGGSRVIGLEPRNMNDVSARVNDGGVTRGDFVGDVGHLA